MGERGAIVCRDVGRVLEKVSFQSVSSDVMEVRSFLIYNDCRFCARNFTGIFSVVYVNWKLTTLHAGAGRLVSRLDNKVLVSEQLFNIKNYKYRS